MSPSCLKELASKICYGESSSIRKLKWHGERAVHAFDQLGAFQGDLSLRAPGNPYNLSLERFLSDGETLYGSVSPASKLELLQLLNSVERIVAKTAHTNSGGSKLYPFELTSSLPKQAFYQNKRKVAWGSVPAWKMLPIYLMTGIDTSSEKFFQSIGPDISKYIPRRLVGKLEQIVTCDFDSINRSNQPDQSIHSDIRARSFRSEVMTYQCVHEGVEIASGKISINRLVLCQNAVIDEKYLEGEMHLETLPVRASEIPNLSKPNCEIVVSQNHRENSLEWTFERSSLTQTLPVLFEDQDPYRPSLWSTVVCSNRMENAAADEIVNIKVSFSIDLLCPVRDLHLSLLDEDENDNETDLAELRNMAIQIYRKNAMLRGIKSQSVEFLNLGWQDIDLETSPVGSQ